MKKRLAVLSLAALMILGLTACGETGDSSAEEPDAGIAVQVQQIEASDVSTENIVSGTVTADNEQSVFVSAAAKCTEVYVEAGDTVTAGQPICRLDLSSTIANRNAAEISYASTVQSYNDQKAILDKQVALAQKAASDTKALFELGAVSQNDVDQAEIAALTAVASRKTALAQLEAGMQTGKASLDQLDTALENVDAEGNVVAPISGTLVSLSAVKDSFVSSSMPVATVDGVDEMKVSVSVSEALVPKLSIGDEAGISVSSIGKTFTGVIRAVEKAASQQTKLYTVTLDVPAGVDGLLTGMFADVTFRTDTVANAVTVPTEAILTDSEGQYVFVVADDGASVVRADVTTGLTGSGVTEITSGVEAGQSIVTVGQSYLKDGDPVRIVSGEE
jgi:RND family efflux transporter MFP subunit